MISDHDHDCNDFPACFGNYQPGCALYSGCAQATRLECLHAAQLEVERRRERLARRRAGELGPVGHHLARLGYPASVCREADDWRAQR